MRISIAFAFALGVLAFLTQDAAAQFMEKKVLTLAAARKRSQRLRRRPSDSIWPKTPCGGR